jgi:thiol-disulfide isomerase/thioredoxin
MTADAGGAGTPRRSGPGRRGLLFGVGAVAAAAGIGGALWQSRVPAEQADALRTLWTLRLERPEGGELVLADYRGRPLLINFWATWCPPCVRELPEIDQFAKSQSGRLQVVGLAIDNRDAVLAFLRKVPLGFPVGLAGLEGTELARGLGNAAGGLPFTVLLDAAGRLAQRKIGETRREELDRWAGAL